MSKLVTPHFRWTEFTDSDTAVALGIENVPGDYEMANIVRVARKLERVRGAFGRPITINSGYRCRQLNDNIPGSSASSYHIDGRAVDIRIEHYDKDTILDLFDLLDSEDPVEIYISDSKDIIHVAY